MKSAPTLLVALLIIGIAGLSGLGSAQARSLIGPTPPISVSSCQILNQLGATYVLSADIGVNEITVRPGLRVCILVVADGITFDLNGHSVIPENNGIIVNASRDVIKGPGVISSRLFGPDIAIVNGTADTVRDLTLGQSFTGIRINNSAGTLIENNTIASVAFYGVDVSGGRGTAIVGNNITAGPLIVNPAGTTGILLSNSPRSLVERNTIQGVGDALVLDAQSGHTLVIKNKLSKNYGSGIVSFSSSNAILANVAESNRMNGISIAGSSNLVVFNHADNNRLRGIGLGNVCNAKNTSFPSGSYNWIILNHATGAPAFFWDGQGTRNTWILDSAGGQPIPVTPPTAQLEC